jgi:hypothetical protein
MREWNPFAENCIRPKVLDCSAMGTNHSTTVTKDEITSFAARFDPQPFHLDQEAAACSCLFGGLIASGWHTAALTMLRLVEGGASIAGGACRCRRVELMAALDPPFGSVKNESNSEVRACSRGE